MLTPRELATVLAALRHWQRTQAELPADELLAAWPQLGPDAPLIPLEIDALCERMNELCGCETPSSFCCGIRGILASIDRRRIVLASVERSDACARYPSDEAAGQHPAALGYLATLS